MALTRHPCRDERQCLDGFIPRTPASHCLHATPVVEGSTKRPGWPLIGSSSASKTVLGSDNCPCHDGWMVFR